MSAAKFRAAAVIPARYASERLPAKALAELDGLPMVARVYQRACQATTVEQVIVATDDERIAAAARAVGAEVVMTDPGHCSGSDRVAEVARALDHDIIVNVQGDLPLLDPAMVDSLVERLRNDPGCELATVAVPIDDPREMADPSVVKLVCRADGRALYFSRAAIPFSRDAAAGSQATALHHVGLYAYRREALLRFSQLEPTALERSEKLEQLRALEHGMDIAVVVMAGGAPLEVDTPADLKRARQALQSGEAGTTA
ncbi:MAG: 3-deoxy-manno-octulosonate cytidylyltransferase [Deltaproteobacteria bacterium]|nr:3-deoxy-manno-octulosonate cytidylyltransferase [Deltaproteobacteria bacterium]